MLSDVAITVALTMVMWFPHRVGSLGRDSVIQDCRKLWETRVNFRLRIMEQMVGTEEEIQN